MTSTDTTRDEFSAEERAAMKAASTELKARRGKKEPVDEEPAVLAKIADFPDADRRLAERFHALVKEVAPELTPTTYYGMPAYAKNGKAIVWFKNASKFKTRYAQIEFSDKAALDDGELWATAFALTELTADAEGRLADLVRRAAG